MKILSTVLGRKRFMAFESNMLNGSGSKSDYALWGRDLGGRNTYGVGKRESVGLSLPVGLGQLPHFTEEKTER